jgi:hypothetical protein
MNGKIKIHDRLRIIDAQSSASFGLGIRLTPKLRHGGCIPPKAVSKPEFLTTTVFPLNILNFRGDRALCTTLFRRNSLSGNCSGLFWSHQLSW